MAEYLIKDIGQSKKEKTILHMDGDAFFVGVEVAKDGRLRGLPVVTGEERGIVSALSYEAKALGIIRGMPIFRVKRDYPQVRILPGDYKSYAEYSSRMFDIVRRYADDVEEYSIDECFADLTGLEPPLKMSYRQIAERIKKEINDELRLSVSIGIAPSKVLAKVASKFKKPNGLTIISRENIDDFLIATPIGKIWGIGPRTAEFLEERGIKTAKDFIDKDINWIHDKLATPYEAIWRELRGEYIMEIDPILKNTYSSIQKTRSFHPANNDEVFLLSQLSKNIEGACTKARHYNLAPQKISFFLKSKDFKYSVYSFNLATPSNAPEILIPLIHNHFNKVFRKGILYRTTGATLQGLVPNSASQGDLFGGSERSNKFETIHKQIDKLEEKYGKRMVYLASTHNALNQKALGTDVDDLDRDLLFL